MFVQGFLSPVAFAAVVWRKSILRELCNKTKKSPPKYQISEFQDFLPKPRCLDFPTVATCKNHQCKSQSYFSQISLLKVQQSQPHSLVRTGSEDLTWILLIILRFQRFSQKKTVRVPKSRGKNFSWLIPIQPIISSEDSNPWVQTSNGWAILRLRHSSSCSQIKCCRILTFQLIALSAMSFCKDRLRWFPQIVLKWKIRNLNPDSSSNCRKWF